MKLYMGGDHRGLKLMNELYDELIKLGIDVEKSLLPHSEEDDYPDFAFDVGKHVLEKEDNLGLVLCGNGIGVSIAANKVKGIRCALAKTSEDAHHARNHNGANVIALGDLDLINALEIVKTFIETPLPTEERHLRRITKIINYENGEYNEL